MQDYLYSVIGFIAIAIHLIINFREMTGRGNISNQKAVNNYRFC